MGSTITESQKKTLMVLLTIIISILVVTTLIVPTNKEIELKQGELAGVEIRRNEMEIIMNDATLKPTLEQLIAEAEINFEKNYRSFEVNEKIEELIYSMDLRFDAINISDYKPIGAGGYMEIAQPRTAEEYAEVRADINGSMLDLFLVAQVTINIPDINNEKGLQLINAINNIQPEGPGDIAMGRYCLEVKSLNMLVANEKNFSSITINVYGMEPPSVLGIVEDPEAEVETAEQ
jgi:hypothetical protein